MHRDRRRNFKSLREAATRIPRGARVIDLSRNAVTELEGAGEILNDVLHLSLYFNKVGLEPP